MLWGGISFRITTYFFKTAVAFRTWQTDTSRAVGFFPFHDDRLGHPSNEKALVGAKHDEKSLMIYSLLSEKAMFVHKLYLNSLPMHQPLSCQEVLLSLQVAAISHKPPVAVVSHPRVLLDDASAEMHQSKSSLRRGKQDSERKREKQCVQEWIQASGMKNLPTEMSKYIGSR